MSTTLDFERLEHFRQQLSLCDAEIASLAPYRDVFLAQADAYAEYFNQYMMSLPETRHFLDIQRRPGLLAANWKRWYERFFQLDLGEEFCLFLWQSGVRHVQAGVDQRYVNLGYCVARGFCQKLVDEHLEPALRPAAAQTLHRMIDFCLLVATDAFISNTMQCDLEVMNGIAHQMRNPLMVIGGNVQRLVRGVEQDDPSRQVYSALLGEARRLERMVADVGAYMRLHQHEPVIRPVGLAMALDAALSGLPPDVRRGVQVEMVLDPALPLVLADAEVLDTLLCELLTNAMEAASAAQAPAVRIASRPNGQGPFLILEIRNNGQPLPADLPSGGFAPFASAKAMGTGFGLPTARLAARKLGAGLDLQSDADGTLCRLRLPWPA